MRRVSFYVLIYYIISNDDSIFSAVSNCCLIQTRETRNEIFKKLVYDLNKNKIDRKD